MCAWAELLSVDLVAACVLKQLVRKACYLCCGSNTVFCCAYLCLALTLIHPSPFRFNEVLEKELVCMKLRNSCLTPSYIMKDLQGRGLITLTDTTAGPLIRLAQRK